MRSRGRILKYIGANVRALRIRRGLTQEQLAERVELDPRFMQRIERGTRNFSVLTLADALADRHAGGPNGQPDLGYLIKPQVTPMLPK